MPTRWLEARELLPVNLSFIPSAEHGHQQSNGVDWPTLIYTINM